MSLRALSVAQGLEITTEALGQLGNDVIASVPSVAIAGTGDYHPRLSSDKGAIIIFLSAFKPLRLLRS